MATAAELALLIAARDKASPTLREIQRELKGIRGRLDETGTASQKAGKGFADLGGAISRLDVGKLAKLGVAGVSLGALTAGLTSTIGAASDLHETLNKNDVVFGSASDSVKRFGDNAVGALGMSRNQAVAAASTFGNLFTTMGLGEADAARMSKGLVQLGADLASFHNAMPVDALNALRSGLVGETEPMRRFGVVVNEAAVTQRALAMGLASSANQVSEAAKVQARYQLILEQTTKAQGDFAHTSDGLANSQRIISAGFEEIGTTIGSALLPMSAPLVSNFAKNLPGAVEATRKAMENLKPYLQGTGDLLGFINREGGKAADAMGKAATAAANAAAPQGTYAQILATTNDELREMYRLEGLNIARQGEAARARREARAAEAEAAASAAQAEADWQATIARMREVDDRDAAEAAKAWKDSAAAAAQRVQDDIDRRASIAKAQNDTREWYEDQAKRAEQAAGKAASAFEKGIREAASAASQAVQGLRSALDDLARTPILGSRAQGERINALSDQVEASRLKIINMRVGKAPKGQIRAEEKRLSDLELRLQQAQQQERVGFDPLRRRIQEAVNPPGREMAFGDIMSRIKGIQPALAAAEAIQNSYNQQTNYVNVTVTADGYRVNGTSADGGVGQRIAEAVQGVLGEFMGSGMRTQAPAPALSPGAH